jgi:hypothetical protein
MKLRTMKLLIMTLAAGIVLTLPASAEPSKPEKVKKRINATAAAQMKVGYHGLDKFPAGPLYNGRDYLGDDPDPFIRFQINRDLSARYGGGD